MLLGHQIRILMVSCTRFALHVPIDEEELVVLIVLVGS